jgi:hypothetical protein
MTRRARAPSHDGRIAARERHPISLQRGNTMTKQAQPQTPVVPTNAQMFAFDAASIESVMQQYTAWMEDIGRVQQESLEFVRSRLERDAQAAARMAECKTPAELMEWQISFTKDAVEDYVRQGQKITSLLMHANGLATRGDKRA